MKVRVTKPGASTPTYLHRLATFVRSYHPYGWQPSDLDNVYALEVTTDTGETAALVWFDLFSPPAVYTFHVCAAPAYYGRWLTRPVLRAMWQMAWDIPISAMVVQCHQSGIADMFERQGFTVLETLNVAIKEFPADGDRENATRRGFAEATGAAGPRGCPGTAGPEAGGDPPRERA